MDQSSSRCNITFIVNFYGEYKIVDRCINSISKFYPNNKIVLISDEETKLKSISNGGRWTLRYLSRFIETNGDVLIRMDPDSLMLRRFNHVPDCDYFGAIFCDRYVHGGCKGFSRKFVERIIDSGLLLSNEYTDLKYRRGVGDQVSDDLICMDIVKKLNASVVNWDEVSMFPHMTKFAVTHGHKN